MAKLFEPNAQFPPRRDIERLAKYARGRKIFEGKPAEVYERASEILRGTPFTKQLRQLYIAVNLMDALLTKPADLLVGEAPTYESGLPDASPQQRAINRVVEENDLNQTVHEITIGGGYRGDSWLKTYYAPRVDFSEVRAAGYDFDEPMPEPIIEAVDAACVFPEMSRGSRKRFRAVNIAYVEWVTVTKLPGIDRYLLKKEDRVYEEPYLVVERHLPGYIVHERFKLISNGYDDRFDIPIRVYMIGEQVPTGRSEDVIKTGVPHILVHHVPYKTVDDTWEGISGIEKLESILAAINDRLVQIDYILWKHSDPTAYGPEVEIEGDADGSIRFGGKYIPVTKDDVAPGYMTWDSQLDGAFKELDILLGLVYQISETPQWLFGTTLAEDKGGSGTSHTDGNAIKARFMPILSKVKRIRVHVDRAIRDAIWSAQLLENFANEGVDGFEPYEPVYPKINWRDGIPKDEKTEAEVFQIRTGGQATLDVKSAIKRMDGVDDEQADAIIQRISADETRVNGTVDSTVFNGGSSAGGSG
ncbi:portal protein [Paenibacillus elgii]|uniref:portal protein n=1 Tax=Paenibacillus elgii TaxID=189691 RepID=UPI000248C30A|nr:portal protein [Paenibacillus elgii]